MHKRPVQTAVQPAVVISRGNGSMEYLIGVVLAAVVCVFAMLLMRRSGFALADSRS